MTEKTFLVKMRKTCDYMLNYAGKKKCTKFRCVQPLNLCDGNLNKRPEWCPIVPVEDRGLNLEDVRVLRVLGEL